MVVLLRVAVMEDRQCFVEFREKKSIARHTLTRWAMSVPVSLLEIMESRWRKNGQIKIYTLLSRAKNLVHENQALPAFTFTVCFVGTNASQYFGVQSCLTIPNFRIIFCVMISKLSPDSTNISSMKRLKENFRPGPYDVM